MIKNFMDEIFKVCKVCKEKVAAFLKNGWHILI
jgi:hypothetical protein